MRSIVLLLVFSLSLISAQFIDFWWGVNDVGCIQGNVPTKDENAPKHLQWARFLLDKVISGEGSTYYDHYAGPIHWGNYSCNAAFISISDCNGLASALLKQAYNMELESPPGFSHAYASTYWHAFVKEREGFIRIREVENIKEGDFIAYNYLYGKNDTQFLSSQNSGHLVVVTSAPKIATSSAPFVPDTIQWSVGIIDQTSDAHFVGDSRWISSTNKTTGLGTGNMRLYTSASNGTFVGYAWSFSPNTTYYKNDVIRSAAVGQLNPSLFPLSSGCGLSLSQSLLREWKAGNDNVPFSQWNVTLSTSNREVSGVKVLISIPEGASFSSWQLNPVAGETNVYAPRDWHLDAGSSLPTNYQFSFGYTVSSRVQAPVYIQESEC